MATNAPFPKNDRGFLITRPLAEETPTTLLVSAKAPSDKRLTQAAQRPVIDSDSDRIHSEATKAAIRD